LPPLDLKFLLEAVMRRTHLATFLTVLVAAGGACSTPPSEPATETAAEATPMVPTAAAESRRVLLDNEYVEVVTLTVEPGANLPSHAGQSRVVYSLGDYRIRYTEAGESRERDWKRGEVHVHGAGAHALENIGASPAQLLIVARKDRGLTQPSGPASEAAGATRPHTSLLLDNDDFLVTEVRLPAGATLAAHEGLDRVAYALSDYTLRYEAEGAPARDATHSAGEAHWHTADRHAVTNTGQTEARYLLVQLRR
jgi:quercetin dioxygenase-like cupin family protein